ncbi:Hypothetical protein MELLADRAFT_94139 [Melampsora larici-populina 98AG31]|uniref:MI domain-containing protein n=1 Tax=Melampsora larici-populina (strain 98AG31 / pathotype 3-4-7) TaxID=747676 RepID=F4S6L9_MELLP|nr:Hypothetical protein MELLADRAFT_94139 [Melampsora larici-populina 98AG31]EGF99712.1 Hypothetical protein MELLADRAFT_94139 [Melampsora larici-populina 98AG31]
MSKTNATPTPANQSASASNDVPASAASSKPTINYAAAAAAARPASSIRTAAGPPNPISPNPLPSPSSFASAVGSNPSPSNPTPSSNNNKPSSRPIDVSPTTSRPINGSSNATAKTPVSVSESRRTSVAGIKAHNVKPSSSSIAFGSLADLPAKSDAAAILSASPANPPTLSERKGPPVFGSVPTDSRKTVDKPSTTSAVTVPPSASVPASKPSVTNTVVEPAAKSEKKKINFQSFFQTGGETAPQPAPPPPPSNGSSQSPSMSYRPDPTQNRRNNTFDSTNQPHLPPASPRPTNLGMPNGANSGSFHSPLSGASRAFTPSQGQPPMSQPPSQPPHQYGPNPPHWQNGPSPNSPHHMTGAPPHPNMPNYPHPNGAMAPPHSHNQSQFLQKPPTFQHRNGPGNQSAPSGSMYPSNGRSNMPHQQRGPMQAPPSPRSATSGAPPSNTPNAPYPHPPNSQGGMNGPYWQQGPYPPSGPGPGYPPYAYNHNGMPIYPQPGSFAPPAHAQHASPQVTHPPGPPSSQPVPPINVSPLPAHPPRTHGATPNLAVPTSPAPATTTFTAPLPQAPAFTPVSAAHSRGPSLSYNANPFNPSPSAVSPDFKPRTPNAAAPPFQPRKSAAIQIKKPITPTGLSHDGTPNQDDGSVTSTPNTASLAPTTLANPPAASDSPVEPKPVEKSTETKVDQTTSIKTEKVSADAGKVSAAAEADKKEQELAAKKAADLATEKKRVEAEQKAAAELEEQRKVEEQKRLEREAKEKADREAKEQAEKDAKAKSDQSEKELMEKQAKAKDAKDAEVVKAAAEAQSASQTKPDSLSTSSKPTEPSSSTATTSTLPGPTASSGLPSKPVNGVSLPASTGNKTRPTPIDVNAVPSQKVNATGETMSPLPSALSSARKIEDLGQVSYPENIKSPHPDLNAEAAPGKFRYDRAFLLQFMEVCKGKPTQLPDLDSIGMVDSQSGSMNPMSRTQSMGGQRRNTGQMTPGGRGPSGSLTPSGGSMSSMMGPGGIPNRAGPGGAGMPMFATGTNRTSEERFSQSNRAILGAIPIGGIGGGLLLPGRPTGQMSRTPSANALPGIMTNGARDGNRRSGRGTRRDGGPPMSTNAPSSNMNRGMQMQSMYPTEVVQPLQSSANSWATARSNQLEEDSPEMVNRKVRALLNKLTLDKFESISDQVIDWANKSEKENDGRILRQVIALIFEKATDEAHWSEMYAKLCRKLMEKLSPEVKDENVLDTAGNKVHGGHLFRKYLLNRCQEDYERGWSKRDELAAAAAGKAADDAVKQAANEKSRAEAEAVGKETTKEAEILSDEYYAAQKAKRQGLGLVRFIGELFKLNMLTERIMHECVKKLLSNIENPEEEDIESLCRLMMTVGKMLDHEKANSHMNVYFTRMTNMAQSKNLTSRARFMIQDVIDTRSNHWVGRNVAAGPKLISQIHEEAAQAAAEQSRQAQAKQNMSKMNDLSRGGSRGGRSRDQFGNTTSADGWSSVGNVAPPPRPSKAGDLTHFGKLRDTSSSGRMTFGPSSVFANKGKGKDGKASTERDPTVAVALNPFALLGADTGESSTNTGSGLVKKQSVSEMAPTSRPRLNLAPRTLPLPGKSEEEETSTTTSKGKTTEEESKEEEEDIDDSTAKRLVKTRIDEFFNVKSIEEGVASFEGLPTKRYFELIRGLIEKSMEMKLVQVKLTCDLFKRLIELKGVKKSVFEKAFEPVIEFLDDTVVDAPSAYEFAGRLLSSIGFEESEVKVMGEKIEAMDLEVAKKRLVDGFLLAKKEA